jgi:hypothetical protein
MANLIQLKRASAWNVSEDPGATTLAEGELAWNNQGKKLWMGRKIATTGTTHELLRINKTLTGTANEVGVSEGTDTWTIGLPNSVTLANDLTVGGDITCSTNMTVTGNLTVNGSTTTVNSSTITVDDKNIELGSVATPTDTTADGGGITLKGATDKTIIWSNANDRWDFNQGISVTGVINATSYTGGNVSEWDTAYSDRNKWDGGSSGLTAATGRTSLGLGTSAVLDTAAVANGASTVSTGDQIYDFVIGLGYSTTTGTVTSVATGTGLTGGTITGSGTIAIDSTVLTTSSTIDGGTF